MISRLLLTFILLLVACGTPVEPPESRPNILLVLIDTIRADHLSCSGYPRSTTPVLDSLVSTGYGWSAAQSQSSWTLPAMVSIMTGLDQRAHGSGWLDGGFYGIDPSLPYLPLILHDHGYRTAAFFNVIFMNEDFGFHRGFDHFDCRGFVGAASTRDAAGTVDDVLAWFDNGTIEERPWFAAVHFFDPHLPYSPPPPWDTLFTTPGYDGPYNSSWGGRDDVTEVNRGNAVLDPEGLENLVGLYDGELAFTDHQLGVLLSELRARGAMSGTLVVIVGDHGEEFLDHGGIGHGHTMFQEILHVPLIISGDSIRSDLFSAIGAAQTDLLTTILVHCGIEVPEVAGGIDLLGGAPPETRVIPSSNLVWESTDLGAVLSGASKLIGNPSTGPGVEYDLDRDPGEFEPMEPSPVLTEELELYWSTPPVGSPQPVPFAESMERTLRDLGYIR